MFTSQYWQSGWSHQLTGIRGPMSAIEVTRQSVSQGKRYFKRATQIFKREESSPSNLARRSARSKIARQPARPLATLHRRLTTVCVIRRRGLVDGQFYKIKRSVQRGLWHAIFGSQVLAP